MMLFIDTSIFIDLLRKKTVGSSKHLFDSILESNDGFTSSITVAELSVGAHLSLKPDAIGKTLDLLRNTPSQESCTPPSRTAPSIQQNFRW